MERTQVMLDPAQKRELDQIAREEKISRSYLLRSIIQESLRTENGNVWKQPSRN